MANNVFKKLKKLLVDDVDKKVIGGLKSRMRKGCDPIVKEVVDQIQKGISPVDGARKFQKYSESYLEAIKADHASVKEKRGQRSPVNMTLSGDMLKSLKIVPKGEKTFLEFTGKETGDRAYFHNNSGAGKARTIRRLLPDAKGEKFNQVLQNKFFEIVQNLMKKIRL